MQKGRVMVNVGKDVHSLLIHAQALMTIERGKKVTQEEVIKRLLSKYIGRRKK